LVLFPSLNCSISVIYSRWWMFFLGGKTYLSHLEVLSLSIPPLFCILKTSVFGKLSTHCPEVKGMMALNVRFEVWIWRMLSSWMLHCMAVVRTDFGGMYCLHHQGGKN
jgi:hypothetical protein